MQNRELLTTVKELREENAALLRTQQKMQQAVEELQTREELEQVVRENAELRRRLQETGDHVMLLQDEIPNLRAQLSKQRRKCNDAEEQRDFQKQFFLKLFMIAKHDMEQSKTHHAEVVEHAISEDYLRVAAKVTASPLDNRNAVALIPCTEDKLTGNLAGAQGTRASKRVHFDLDASRLDGKASKVSLPHLGPSSPVHRAKMNVNRPLGKFEGPYAL